MKKHKIVLAITGASGAIYAKVLLDKLTTLKSQIGSIGLVMSDNAKYVWKQELENEDYKNYNLNHYSKLDFSAPFASGSATFTYSPWTKLK